MIQAHVLSRIEQAASCKRRSAHARQARAEPPEFVVRRRQALRESGQVGNFHVCRPTGRIAPERKFRVGRRRKAHVTRVATSLNSCSRSGLEPAHPKL